MRAEFQTEAVPGFDLARNAARVRRSIQVVLMTGHEAGAMIGQVMKRPPVILQKPFWFEHLIQALSANFAAKGPERARSQAV
jgi:FixJ family two-component response regulator